MSRAEASAPAPAPAPARILVWDAPVRVVHWLLVLCFVTAYATSETDRWRLVHVTAGYTMGGLVAFRVVWGLLGTRHARFAGFVRRPRAVLDYLMGLMQGTPEHHVGHNPAGAVAILALLAMVALSVATGWATYNEWGPELLEEVHEVAGNLMLVVVLGHILGVAVSSRAHHENLVRAMVTGYKSGAPGEGIAHAWRWLAALLLASAVGFWVWQWQHAPVGAGGDEVAAQRQGQDDEDED